jgi:hypothetical protein
LLLSPASCRVYGLDANRQTVVRFASMFIYGTVNQIATKNWSSSPLTFLFSATISMFITAAIFLEIRNELSNRVLVMSGDCVVGRVLTQEWTGGKTKSSKITYEFKGPRREALARQGQ